MNCTIVSAILLGGFKATDADPVNSKNSSVDYSLDASSTVLFQIKAGEAGLVGLFLLQAINVDIVNSPMVYYPVLSACDQGPVPRCSSVTLTINILDVNDNAPFFNTSAFITGSAASNRFAIPGNPNSDPTYFVLATAPTDTVIFTAVAKDADRTSPNNVISYTTSGDPVPFVFFGPLFRISGPVVSVYPPYNVTVVASDGGLPATTPDMKSVQIGVLDMPAFVNPGVVAFAELLPANVTVATITVNVYVYDVTNLLL